MKLERPISELEKRLRTTCYLLLISLVSGWAPIGWLLLALVWFDEASMGSIYPDVLPLSLLGFLAITTPLLIAAMYAVLRNASALGDARLSYPALLVIYSLILLVPGIILIKQTNMAAFLVVAGTLLYLLSVLLFLAFSFKPLKRVFSKKGLLASVLMLIPPLGFGIMGHLILNSLDKSRKPTEEDFVKITEAAKNVKDVVELAHSVGLSPYFVSAILQEADFKIVGMEVV